MTHYDALGVSAGAGPAEVRRAYLAAARRHHPDFHAAADEQTRAGHARQMQAINQAWAVLGDPAARATYDRVLSGDDPSTSGAEVRRRGEPVVPAGKGWTPRTDDDGWQDDFRSWADEDERLAPDGPGRPRNRGALAVLPVALFAVAVGALFLGLVLGGRPLLAIGFGCLVVSATLFVMLPIIEMSRGRHRD